MKEHKLSLREQADRLKITPSDRVWNRLESRLDQDQGKIKVSTIRRWVAIAASLLVVTITYFLVGPVPDKSNKMVLVELESVPNASFASYQYANQFNSIYERDGWKQISEGTKRRLKGKRDQSVFPTVRSQEDTL
jgi:hypothetical protein